jgi:hypothetical protein
LGNSSFLDINATDATKTISLLGVTNTIFLLGIDATIFLLDVGAIFSLVPKKRNRRTPQEEWQVPPWKYSKPGVDALWDHLLLLAAILWIKGWVLAGHGLGHLIQATQGSRGKVDSSYLWHILL